MIVNPTTWKAFIANHPDKDALDANMDTISAAFSPSKTVTELFELALGTDPSLFLVLPFETVAPSVIHHVSKVYQNATSNAEHFCLMGWNESAAAIKITPENFFGKLVSNQIEGETSNKVKRIRVEGLRNALDKDQFGSDNKIIQDETMDLRKCIPLVPSIASLFIDISSTDPHEIGAILAEKIAEIENARDHPLHKMMTTDAGRKTIDEILTWLWYAPRIPDMKVNCPMAYHDSRIDKAARKIHADKLQKTNVHRPSTNPSNEFADIIAAALSRQASSLDNQMATLTRHTAAIQELAESKCESGSERSSSSSEKGFSKLPGVIQKFLLAMASTDLEEPAIELPKSGLDMLNMSQKHATLTLPIWIDANGRSCSGLSSSLIQDITSIVWCDPNNPFTGIATCRIAPRLKAISASSAQAKKAKKIYLLEKLEVDRREVVEELMDNSLFRPTSAEDVIRSVETVLGILEIYLGPESAVVQRIVDLVSNLKRKQDKLDLKAMADENFLTKIQFSFDERLNEWMSEMYKYSSNLLEVDHSLIDFTTIDRNIKHGSFAINLPPCLCPVNKNKRSADEISEPLSDHTSGKPSDEPKEKQQKNTTGTSNTDINPKWKLKDGEKWEHFNKDPNKLRPSSVCLMYHILGKCPQGDKCRRAKSHRRLTNEAQIKQTDDFIEDCRKNARP